MNIIHFLFRNHALLKLLGPDHHNVCFLCVCVFCTKNLHTGSHHAAVCTLCDWPVGSSSPPDLLSACSLAKRAAWCASFSLGVATI